MSRYRFRDDDSSTTATVIGVLAGAIAGFAAGMYVAQHMGGIQGIKDGIKRRARAASPFTYDPAHVEDYEELDDYDEDEIEDEGDGEGEHALELRVLEAFRNDPILSERAVDIGSIGNATIELAGWVDMPDEADHAVTLARGVPGVNNVLNRLEVGQEEASYRDAARRFADGDPSLTDARWEGNTVGTGRRRQGTSDEPDRHADPKVRLDERWSDTSSALRNPAEDPIPPRQSKGRGRPGDRTNGAPVAPTGVPKADHVARPLEADAGE
jgi:hypothetical protein